MIGMVYLLLSVSRMVGRKRLFQLETKQKMAWVAMAGFMMGSAMRLKVLNSPEPSIRAESSSSRGKEDSMNCRMKNTVAGAAMEGRISARKLLVMWI